FSSLVLDLSFLSHQTDVTTVLLVDNTGRHRDGRFHKKAVGLLTSTARTFVQEGTTTEFATQVVGTTLDNGRLYAQVVTTSSRVFYHGDSKGRDKTRTNLDELVLPPITLVADIARPTKPIQVLPSQTGDSVIKVEPFSYAKSGNIYQTAVNGQHTPHSRYIGEHPRAGGNVISTSVITRESSGMAQGPEVDSKDELEELFLQAKAKKLTNKHYLPSKEDQGQDSENLLKAKRMEYFSKRNTGDAGEGEDSEINGVSPARVVRPLDGLPTFTVRHEFAPSGFSVDDNEDSTESHNTEANLRSNRFRSGKAYFGGNRMEHRKLDTVTYLGFSDFTTTVGDTVIIFMPHTRAAGGENQGRKATSILGDATLAPELQHVSTETPVSVVTSIKTFMSHTPGMVTRTITGHSLSMQTALPTMVVLPETSSRSVTISRDHKALQSAQVVEPITENPPTDFEDAAQYLAHEQLEMAEKIPTTPAQDLITEPFFGIDTIDPSSVSYDYKLEPSIEDVIESSPAESSTEEIGIQATNSLSSFSTAQTQLFDTGGAEFPLGLIKVIGGTEALNGTTTLFTSLIYGTYVNGNYAQVIHSTSSIFFYIDQTKVDMTDAHKSIQPTAVVDTIQNSVTHVTHMLSETTSKAAEETEGTTPPTTSPLTVDSSNELPQTTEGNAITAAELATTEGDSSRTTQEESSRTTPTEETTDSETYSINEVETGRKITSKPKEDTTAEKDTKNKQKDKEFHVADSDGRQHETSRTPPSSATDGPITQLIPTTVYKTFTYLTTFFIPAEGTSTTTSIRSREVTTAEKSYVTRIFSPDAETSKEQTPFRTNGAIQPSSSVPSPTASLADEESLHTTPESITVETTNNDEVNTMTTPNLPEEKTTVIPDEIKVTTPSPTTPDDNVQGEEDEIELIFKTLYTTYTYLTTFFQEHTTSVSSREVVVTNVITSTVDSSYILHASDPAVIGLLAHEDTLVTPSTHSPSSIEPTPTSVGVGRPTTKYFPDLGTSSDSDLFSTVIESVDLEKELATPTPILNKYGESGTLDKELKTFYTTYTYFTTILVDGETEISSRTEIYTNIVTPSGLLASPTVVMIEPTISLREPLFEKDSDLDVVHQVESPRQPNLYSDIIESSQDINHIKTPILRSTPLYSYSSTISRSHKSPSYGTESSHVNSVDVDDEENSIFPRNTPRTGSIYATISRARNSATIQTVLEENSSPKPPATSREADSDLRSTPVAVASSLVSDKPAVVETMSTDVTSSSSDGGKVMMLEKRNDRHPLLDDQISSESNTEDLEPSPTLLLQTSYTTFTYFTTVYKGSSSEVVSRLETVTNVVTETLAPSAAPTRIAPEDATLPITYFTTFTYWTTLFKDGSTVVTSREETISNTVTPTLSPSSSNATTLDVTTTPTLEEITLPSSTPASIEPATFYTTYTYFTTSYIGNNTVLNSRLETVTNIINEGASDATGRAIGSGATEQNILEPATKISMPVDSPLPLQPTGLLSTIVTSEVNNGTTTLFSTDVYGTFIDGLYAQVLESSTEIVTPTPVFSDKINLVLKPTGVVSLHEGRIVDADGVSTTYFTTKAIGTYIDTLYAEVVESTTSINVNTERQSVLAAISPSTAEGVKVQRTGLVRIVEGSIVKDQTTTFYESRVVGTLIDGRYAQIIESTSSFKAAVTPTSVPGSRVNEIAATATQSPYVSVTPTLSSTTSPTPAVIESSLSEGSGATDSETEDDGDNGEDTEGDEDVSKNRKKSRLTFSTRKRTFTPQIRPFASRNRPTFNPKRKTAIGSSATTITRATVTPTITATPAAKSETNGNGKGRFNNNRRGSSSGLYKTNYSDIRATPSGTTGARRTSRTRGTTGGGTSAFSTHYTGRGRSSVGTSRLYATSTPGQVSTSRRGGFYRSSSSRSAVSSDYPFRGSTTGSHQGASSSRFRIRPTHSSILGRTGSTTFTTPSTDETLEPEDDLTTIVTDETPQFTDEEQDPPTQPISTSTESSRRSSNPLLRFRRPPTLRTPQTTSTTPKPTTTQSSRRSPLLRRPASERGSTTTRPPTNNRYNPVTPRQRPANSLFPPRGLLKKPEKDDEEDKKNEDENEGDEQDEHEEVRGEKEDDGDIGDNEYDGSETSESKEKPNKSPNRRSDKAYNPVHIRPFVGFNRKVRTKRQAEFGTKSGTGSTRSFTPRYRRPGLSTRSPQESTEDPEFVQDTTKSKSANPGRFTPRPRTSASTQPRVRPTSASSNMGRSQFTLRKEDTTANNRANFRRPTTAPPRRRTTNNKPPEPTASAQRPKPPRLRTQSNNRQSEATTYSRSPPRRNPNTNRRGSTRTRYRGETSDYDTYTYSQSSFDGSITVTHRIPTEVTIPVVNGRITEYRNVITASASTEVLGPHQYTVSTAKDGNTVLYLTSEVTGTLPGGVTEITQFVIHETPTTSVIFTPTIIRGHKTSFSHIVPSTVYDVEQVVSTLQPQISPNAPLANILLSQLLLGNLGLQPNLNPLLALNNPGPPPSPTTEFKTRQTTYVTTVTKGMSTVIPLTFRGKEILTTIVDSSTEVITATEFITDTIVVTPTAALNAGSNQLNSLLLPALLQAQLLGGQTQQQPITSNPLLAGLQQQINQQESKPVHDIALEDIAPELPSRHRQRPPDDADRLARDSEKEILDDDAVQNVKEEESGRDRTFKTSRKKSRTDKKPPDPPPIPAETSVVTLYVSGRRPGEFSTVISTVTLGDESSAVIKKREVEFVAPEMFILKASQVPEIGGSFPTSDDDGYLDHYVMSAMNEVSGQASETETQSLESIVGDVSSYVSSVIGNSSPSSELLVLKSSSTENPTPSSTENKKKVSMKKIIASSFNSSSSAGHFLSNGPAEFAPLKRKVKNQENRGMLSTSCNKKQNTSKRNIQLQPKPRNSTQTTAIKQTEALRKKRNTDVSLGETDNSDVLSKTSSHQRRKVRIKVPINRKKLNEDKNVNTGEILTLSEAQHTLRIPDMDIGAEDINKHGQGNVSLKPEYGSRMVKIIHGHGPANLSSSEDTNDHQRRRVVVTRRKKPDHSTVDYIPEDTFISRSVPGNNTSGMVKDGLVITTYRPKEIPFFSSSNTAVAERDLYLLPTTVRGDKVSMQTTPGRRRVVVTKKRPIVITPSQRRRIVVTKKRPVPKFETDIEPTYVIPDSMSTLYSYKYTVLNRDKGLNTDTENMVKVSQVFMSGEIKQGVYDGTTSVEESKKHSYDKETTTPFKTNAGLHISVTEQDTDALISTQANDEEQDSTPSSSLLGTVASTSKLITIPPPQIESSFYVPTRNLESETPTFEVSTQNLPLEVSSLKISLVTPTDYETIKPLNLTSVHKPENYYESTSTEADIGVEENNKHISVKEKHGHETDTKYSQEHDNGNTVAKDEITTASINTTKDTLISLTEENLFDGPRFIRPTRFSITRQPGRTKTTFPGRRRTSNLTPSSTVGSHNIHSSSGNNKSSYRSRRPSTTSRTFGRSSKTHKHLYTTPPTNAFTAATFSNFEDTPSYSLSHSSSNTFFDDSSLKTHKNSDSSSDSLPISLSVTAVLATTASSSTLAPDISSTTVMETVTSTRLRTYTYIVTRVAGQEQVVTSTTEVKPHVTTIVVTKTLPVLATELPVNGRGLNMNSVGEARYNLATKVMSNGVEVIVAGDRSTLPGEPEVLRVLSSSISRPITLAPSTLTDHMVLFLPHANSQIEAQLSSSLQQNVFVTKTYVTTYTYLTTFLQSGITTVSSSEEIVSNVVTEERTGSNMKTQTPTIGITLSASPSLFTGVFHTTYTYLNTLIDGDVPLVVTSQRTVANTLTAPHDYLPQLQQSRQSTLDTNTYLSTVSFTKTLTDGAEVKVVSTKDILTQIVITESDKEATEVKGPTESSPTVSRPSAQPGSITNIVKTYFVTYTYFSTFLEGSSTVIRTNIATSSDVVTEKFYVSPKRTMPPSLSPTKSQDEIKIKPTSKKTEKTDLQKQSLHLYATKTYLTTFTYFTTLLQDSGGDRTSTVVSSRTKIVQNIVTETVDNSLLDPEYLDLLHSSIHSNSLSSPSIVATATLSGGQELKITAMNHDLRPTSVVETEVTPTSLHHEISSSMDEVSNNINNIIKGSTIIFFDEEDQIDSSSTSRTLAIEMGGHTKATPSLSSVLSISQVQSTVVNTGAETVLFPQDVVGAQSLVSSSTPIQESVATALPSSFPITISTVSYLTSILPTSTATPSGATLQPGEQVIMMTQPGGNVTMIPVSDPSNKKPTGGFGPGGNEIQVSDLLSLGSLGINGLNALGPVINAMAGLIHSNLNNDKRRNDTAVINVPSTTPKIRTAYYGDNNGNPLPVYVPPKPVNPPGLDGTTPVRSPIYIPVGAAAGDDTEDVATAESQRYEGIANLNGDVKWPDKGFSDIHQRHPIDSAAMGRPIESALLGDGIPISPGQVITANSDVIVGKPAIMGPRPPKISNNKEEIPLGMKPPPPPALPIWPNRDTPSVHPPNREHSSGHMPLRDSFPPPADRNHVPLRDHIPLREHIYHSSAHHLPPADGIPLLPPPLDKPDITLHPPDIHGNYKDSNEQILYAPAKASSSPALQTIFEVKPVSQGTDIIHGNPVPVFAQTEPNSLDRSSGTPLLVNLQPSQVAHVIIPHSASTVAHPFSDQGSEFYDPSPYPLPESIPGFVGIDGLENKPHNIHPENHAPHVSKISGTRMDLPPQGSENIHHANDNIAQQDINVEISPGQGINVDVRPTHGINIDVSPGQGINVDVRPGQGLNVEIASGHFSVEGEHISPSGIVLDVPLQGRPGTAYRRPNPNVHSHRHRPSRPLTQQLPPLPTPANQLPAVSKPLLHIHSFPHHPKPPTDFMTPPPPPHTHFEPDSFHNSGNFHGPAIPLNPSQIHPPGPKTQDQVIKSDHNDDQIEVEGGEVIQESNQRPLRPGQIPVEVLVASSASTHRPTIVRPDVKLETKHDEALHQMKPPQPVFDKPLPPDRVLKPNSENRPYKPNYKERPHITATAQRPYNTPQTNFDKIPHSTNASELMEEFLSNERPLLPDFEKIPEHEVVIEDGQQILNTWNHLKEKTVTSHLDGTLHKVQPQTHQSELLDIKLHSNLQNHPEFSKYDDNSRPNNTLKVSSGGANMNHRPQQQIFDKYDDLHKLEKPSTSESLFDLETQANTPRPFSILPFAPKRPGFDLNSHQLVVGLSPPPPVTPSGTSGQHFPMLGIESQISSHRPVISTGNHRRPPIGNKPPPYKFELPSTTEPSSTTPKTSDKRPFWIRPTLHEISSPVRINSDSGTKSNKDEDKNFMKTPSLSQDSSHTQRHPITTWRPPMSSDGAKPFGHPTLQPIKSNTSHSSVAFDDTSRGPDSHKVTAGVVKPLLSDSESVLQTVVIGKPIPQEPVISPTAVKDSGKRKTNYSTGILWNKDIIVGSEIPELEEHGHAPVSENNARNKTSVSAATATLITSGSDTVHVSLFTKPSTVMVKPSKTVGHKLSTSLVSGHHKENESSYHPSNDSDDDDDNRSGAEFESKNNHKTGLGIESSSDNKIIFSSTIEIPTHYITHTHTQTITLTETTVISSHGHQPSTQTIVLTKTQTSTVVDTVTETEIHTLVRPTSVVATVTTTVSATPSAYPPGSPFDPANYPTFPVKPVSATPIQDTGHKSKDEQLNPTSTSEENEHYEEKNSYGVRKDNISSNIGVLAGGPDENESFFVVVNDQKPATININKGTKGGEEYHEVANHDESDPNNEVNNAVLLGGVLIAAPPRHNTPSTHSNNRDQGSNSCRPDCSASRNELCQKVEGHMRCVCRPGFARMFPDRPCRPTYTYGMKVALARHGKETLRYGSSMEDTTSTHYQQLAEAAREGLDRMVMQSDLRDIYHGVVVDGFQPDDQGDGVTVNFYVQLSENVEEARLQDVFRKSLRTSNYSLGSTEMYANKDLIHHIKAEDFDECQSRQFHDCSEHAQCFNLRGTYTCSCNDGYTDLSENTLFPGRVCSAELIGCEKCHYHGTCYSRGDDQLMCECFQWYAGENCHINLKVLLIALVTIGAILLGLLIVCVVLTCLKRSSQRACSTGTGFLRYRSPTHTLDKCAMIQDSSSEGSAADNGPVSYLTPTHQPASTFGSQMKPALVHAGSRKVSTAVESSDEGMPYSEQRDRSLTVMIPRAKYRPIPPTSPLLAMSTFGAEQKRAIAQEQQKLLSYLETGNKQENHSAANTKRKQSNSTNQTNETAPPPSRKSSAPRKPSTGALVSAGFEVSATVGQKQPGSDTDVTTAAIAHCSGGNSGDNRNTLASNGSHFTTMRTNDSEANKPDLEAASTTDSQQDTNSRVQELTVSEARSFDETTVQPPTKSFHSNYGSNPSSRNPNDEAHTMAERDLGSTLLMPQTHLYKPDRGSDISNFDSL
ncbi:hypothetical protein Cfor_04066, partial [Coptotermes formosanus]